MFTGLVTVVGRIEGRRPRGGGAAELTISADGWEAPLQTGESIAVQGVCLTVTFAGSRNFGCDLLRETLRISSLGRRRTGDPVNLERALKAGDRLGGHLVSGHIDGQGTCVALGRSGPDHTVTIQAERELLAGLVSKGSVACDGVSLTVAALATDRFTVHVIPHTWSVTTLGKLRTGDRVNLETDLLGKYAARCGALQDWPQRGSGGVTLEQLGRCGFDI